MSGDVPAGVERLARGDLARLVELCEAAVPGEELDLDALETACGGPDDVLLGLADGSGAAAVAPGADPAVHHLQLVVVLPAAQGRGRGRALLDAAGVAARDAGARRLQLGGAASGVRYLWPGIDVRQLRMLALADSLGARWEGAALNMACTSTFRAPVPGGIEVTRAIDGPSADAVLAFVGAEFPRWVPETERGIEHGTAFAAARDGCVVGFACHSVNRRGWFGPTGVAPPARGAGIGAALLAATCRDLMAAGHQTVEIAWLGPVAFYAKAAGAAVSRVFRTGWLPL